MESLQVACEASRIWRRHIKPPRGLGVLEDIAVQLASIQGTVAPRLRKKRIAVFCADHGVAAEGVSALSQDVTRHLIEVSLSGRSAISIFCRQATAELQIVDVGVKGGTAYHPSLFNRNIADGTQNIRRLPAMTKVQYKKALMVGREVALMAAASGVDLLGLGEIGIGNTTSASALMSALLKLAPRETVGRGSGIGGKTLARKREIVEESLNLHKALLVSTADILRVLGGYEIVAMTGAILAGAQKRMALVVDGFTSSVAALAALKIRPEVKANLIFSHLSGERGHKVLLKAIGASPILGLGMRLGEGTGAALCIPIVELSCELLRDLDCF